MDSGLAWRGMALNASSWSRSGRARTRREPGEVRGNGEGVRRQDGPGDCRPTAGIVRQDAGDGGDRGTPPRVTTPAPADRRQRPRVPVGQRRGTRRRPSPSPGSSRRHRQHRRPLTTASRGTRGASRPGSGSQTVSVVTVRAWDNRGHRGTASGRKQKHKCPAGLKPSQICQWFSDINLQLSQQQHKGALCNSQPRDHQLAEYGPGLHI